MLQADMHVAWDLSRAIHPRSVPGCNAAARNLCLVCTVLGGYHKSGDTPHSKVSGRSPEIPEYPSTAEADREARDSATPGADYSSKGMAGLLMAALTTGIPRAPRVAGPSALVSVCSPPPPFHRRPSSVLAMYGRQSPVSTVSPFRDTLDTCNLNPA